MRDVARWIDDIEELPSAFTQVVTSLADRQLDTPYRPGGWTVRQVVHHVPDSHLNAYVRFMWALTENEPLIKAYDEVSWARVHDSRSMPVGASLDLLHTLHRRWVVLLRLLGPTELDLRSCIPSPVLRPSPRRWPRTRGTVDITSPTSSTLRLGRNGHDRPIYKPNDAPLCRSVQPATSTCLGISLTDAACSGTSCVYKVRYEKKWSRIH